MTHISSAEHLRKAWQDRSSGPSQFPIHEMSLVTCCGPFLWKGLGLGSLICLTKQIYLIFLL